MKRLEYYWYTRNPWLLLLTPLSLVFRLAVSLRRFSYRTGLRARHKIPVPLIVIGNITVGGTGKTPLVGWLAGFLRDAGYRPGIVARGYGGNARSWPQQVRPDSDPRMVGDEAVVLAGTCRCPMAVDPDRVAAANALVKQSGCDLILSDDGLQHYAMRRDIEIAVIDGVRRFGNGFCLPAGPLREPKKRIEEVDIVVVNGLGSGREYSMNIRPGRLTSLLDDAKTCQLSDFRGRSVHAVAAIGHPERFFSFLREAGLSIDEHVFRDHHAFSAPELDFCDDRPVIMTEKDAVKCRAFAAQNFWFVPLTVQMPPEFGNKVLEQLNEKQH